MLSSLPDPTIVVEKMLLLLRTVTKDQERSYPACSQKLHEFRGAFNKICVQHTLSIFLNHQCETLESVDESANSGGNLPREAFKPHDGKLASWSMSIPNFILSLMANDIGWDTEKYPNVAAWEKECRHRESDKRKADTNKPLSQVNSTISETSPAEESSCTPHPYNYNVIDMDYAYDYIIRETERFRKHLQDEFSENYYYKEKSQSAYTQRWKKGKPGYTKIPHEKYLRLPHALPYHNWFMYAVRYLDSSPKLPKIAEMNSPSKDFALMRVRRLWRFILDAYPENDPQEIQKCIEHLHALRYSNSIQGKDLIYSYNIIARTLQDRRWWDNFNKRIAAKYSVYPAYHQYLMTRSSDAWTSTSLSERHDESVEDKEDLQYILAELKKATAVIPPEELRDEILNKQFELCFSQYGYRKLYQKVSSIPQNKHETSNLIFSAFIDLSLASNSDYLLKSMQLLDREFTVWCGDLYNKYFQAVDQNLNWRSLTPEILEEAMKIIDQNTTFDNLSIDTV